MTRADRAEAYMRRGCGCAQAVSMAFAEEMGLTEPQIARMASSFGGGVGHMGEVCGAISGMALVYGALRGVADHPTREEKYAHYDRMRALAEPMRTLYGVIRCDELLAPFKAGQVQEKPCIALVRRAVELLEQALA